ncbi:nucleotidyltransferase domain-containing protein [Vitiosangium sp. GDMCC 1.1324]|uniref:nucleotidyltransferase domain-containing protein n=1 Tax=Vitiosangium sp. (strain GDMCC 1.1324) TaxID=2138576 RepID=UPI000D3511F2|nr:nucleotidyltransferase domain-containing protein [Vitiosangium sp. GDMCC 1.1324]PTL78724.1 hypothetical protein DAT35_37280 [Vitiosangium sp. GDMCC 1.1324]
MEERFKVAVAQALEDLKSDPEIRVVQIFGSVHRGQPHAHSDIDLYVLSSRNAFWRTCKVYGDVQAEAIIGPQQGFDRIILSRDVLAVQSFAHGGTLLDRDGTVPALSALARKVFDEGPAPMRTSLRTKNRAVLTRHMAKLARLSDDSVVAKLVAADALQTVILSFYQHHRIWMNNLATRLRLIEERDPRLGKLLHDFYMGGQKPQQAIAAIEVMLEQLGGPLVDYVSEQVPWPARPQQSSEGNPG